jgi:hypothetical protein
MTELFSLWTSLDLSKSETGEAGEQAENKAPIGGIISTDTVDLQGDRILQAGCDWSYFLKRGWFNYEHKPGAENIVGIPKSVQPVTLEGGKQATRVEGVLLLDRPRAKEVYEAAKAIQKAGEGRSIGFSVEGQVLQRDPANPKIVTKARILNVSVTAHPVNPDARLEVLARSLEANELDTELNNYKSVDILEEPTDMNKGKAGYADPAKPDPSASLSPMVKESLDKTPAVKQEEGTESLLRRIVREELSNAKVPFEKTMISLPEMIGLLDKVYPNIPKTETRSLARKLLSAAKSYSK